MVVKRRLSCEEENDKQQSYQPTQQPQKFTKCYCKDKFWLQAYSAQLENIIRKVVREEVQQVILQQSYNSIPSSLGNQVTPCETRKFKLQFEGKLPRKLFTGNKVLAKGSSNSPIRLFLLDAASGHPVTEGPLSSAKVKIVVLHGHFKAEEQENWTRHEFDSNIVSERDGKRPILVGQHVVVALQNGMGLIADVSITDNSSWGRSKKFRLGAKVEAKEDLVMEAVSSPFEVKDRRGEIYKKHKIPSPEDEVWRLCGIAKDGKICRRLAEYQIYKVKDLVTLYHLDESLLRQALNVAPKRWEAIVQRATSSFSGHSRKCPNASASIDIPSLNLQQFFMPSLCHDEQENHMSHIPDNHVMDQSMNLNDSSIRDLLARSYNDDDAQFSSLDDTMLPSFPTLYNRFSAGSSSNSDIEMLSTDPYAGVNASELAWTEEGWDAFQGTSKSLAELYESNEAVAKKGKFPLYSQQQAACP